MDKRLTSVGIEDAKDGGETIVFTLGTGGGVHEFECSHNDLSNVVMSLQQAGQRASQERSKSPFAELKQDVVSARPVTSIRVGKFEGGDLAIQFATEGGVPILVSISPDQARDLSTRLHGELAAPEPKKSH